MAINDEIAAGGRPIQMENPLNNMVKFANIQNDMANLQLHKQKAEADAAGMARKNELYNYLGSGGRDPNRIFQLGGHEELNQIRQGESARITGEKTAGETLDAAIKRTKGLLQDFGDTPKAGRQLTYMQFTDPVLKKYFNQLGVSLEQALARIPDDPTEYRNWREQSIIGMDKHLDNLAFKTPHNLGNRIELTNTRGETAPNPMMIGATIKERSEIPPDILTGLANQDALEQQIKQGNPAGQAPVASQATQLLNASVAQANDQTPPPISPLAANVNRQQAELAAVNTKLRADQEQAAADKKAFEFKTLVADVAKLEAAGEGNSPTAQRLKARIAKETHIPPASGELSEEQLDALYGPSGAVTLRKLDPYKINGRNAKILANAYLLNPNIDMNKLGGEAALGRNPNFMNKQYSVEMLPTMLKNMVDAGTKLKFSDVQFVGKLQAWYKGQTNDPAFVNYMAQRNDFLLGLAASMRGNGATDQAHRAEIEAAHPTMSPSALAAYAAGEGAAFIPRLELSSKFTGTKPPAEAATPNAPAKTVTGQTVKNW